MNHRKNKQMDMYLMSGMDVMCRMLGCIENPK